MGWGGANGDRKRSERAARLLRESGSTWLSARRDSRDRYVCSGLAVAGEGIFNMGLARAIPAQRNTRGHWIIHPATSGGDASIPSSPGGARSREDAALGDPHQAPAHLSCFGWAEDFRNRVCQYCYGLFDQLRAGATRRRLPLQCTDWRDVVGSAGTINRPFSAASAWAPVSG